MMLLSESTIATKKSSCGSAPSAAGPREPLTAHWMFRSAHLRLPVKYVLADDVVIGIDDRDEEIELRLGALCSRTTGRLDGKFDVHRQTVSVPVIIAVEHRLGHFRCEHHIRGVT